MKLITLFFTFCACLSTLNARDPHNREALKRLSLMSYASYIEAQHPYDLKWDTRTTSNFSIFSKAHAYKEGDPCLILGFKSVYLNGMCRLSKAIGAKEFKNSCHRGEYACNPQVFGKNGSRPFCVSASLGSELSKYCAHQSVKSLTDTESLVKYSKKTQVALKKISNTPPQDFNFELVLEATDDKQFNESFNALFIDPHTLEKSKEFTSNLCGAIQSSRKSKAHGLDLSICEAQLKLLSSTDSEKFNEEEIKKIITSHDTKKESEVEKVSSTTLEMTLENPKKSCAPKIEKTETQKNIEDIKVITRNLEAGLYMKCINELAYHKDFPSEARGKYIHNIGNKKHFAKQCWKLDNHGQDAVVYSFVSEDGFKMINYPVYNYTVPGTDIETNHPRNLLKFYDGDKPYYISQLNNAGQYFDSFPVNELNTFATEQDLLRSPSTLLRKYIKPYEEYLVKDGRSKNIQLTSPEEAGYSSEQAKSCIKERLKEYVSIIMSRSHARVYPYYNEINADLKVIPRSSLRHKYSKTTDEIKSELQNNIIHQSSACQSIITDNDFNDAFKRAYGERQKTYDEYRQYFID